MDMTALQQAVERNTAAVNNAVAQFQRLTPLVVDPTVVAPVVDALNTSSAALEAAVAALPA